MLPPLYHLRRHILRTTTKRRIFDPLLTPLRQTKIGQPHMPVTVNDDVLGFEVAVDDVVLVEGDQGRKDLQEVEAGLVLGHTAEALQ